MDLFILISPGLFLVTQTFQITLSGVGGGNPVLRQIRGVSFPLSDPLVTPFSPDKSSPFHGPPAPTSKG